MAKEMIAMILAGGQGSRLYALTQKLAKPAVPFGGKYRIKGTLRFQSCSDSNCVPGRYDFDITGETVVEQPVVKEVAKPVEPAVKKEEPAVEICVVSLMDMDIQ